MVFFRFLMVLASFGGLEGSRRAILGPMLGDVGCKMGPRWVREGSESDFFAQLGAKMGLIRPTWRQDGKIKPPKMGPGWRKLEELGASWRKLEELGSAGGGGVVQQGGGI